MSRKTLTDCCSAIVHDYLWQRGGAAVGVNRALRRWFWNRFTRPGHGFILYFVAKMPQVPFHKFSWAVILILRRSLYD